MNKDLIDLLVDFDEMGFCPTTLTANPDEYAKEWKQKLIYAIEKQLERYKNKAKHYYNECKLYGNACYIDNDLED